MSQLVAVLVIIILVFLFGMQNMQHTRVNFPLAGGSEVPTIFLLIVSFFLGYAVATIMWSINFFKKRNKK
ncbi:MAG: lipopolysaccharide assembly protein LapA domain-containing protein [Deltaproteobacteria bacterium]